MLIKCPECQRDISDTAPSCPGCGYVLRPPTPQIPQAGPTATVDPYKNLPSYHDPRARSPDPGVVAYPNAATGTRRSRWWIIPVALCGIVLFLFIVAALSQGGSTSTTADSANSASAASSATDLAPGAQDAAPAGYGLGQPITQNGYQMTVTGLSTPRAVGNEFDTEAASEGGVLVAVDYTVRDVSEKPLGAFDLPKLVLIDGAGTKYDEEFTKTAAYQIERNVDEKALSNLNPGILVHGAAVFEVGQQLFDPRKWTLAIGDADGPRISLASMRPAQPPAPTASGGAP